MYSNTELVIEYAPLVGALQLMQVLSYDIEPDIRPDLKGKIKDMPKVHELVGDYHNALRISHELIESSDMDNDWRDLQFSAARAKAERTLGLGLKKYPWVTSDFLDKCYRD